MLLLIENQTCCINLLAFLKTTMYGVTQMWAKRKEKRTMNARVYESSEYCRRKLVERRPKELPWKLLKPGFSFFIPFDCVEQATLRSLVSAAASREGKILKCFRNEGEGAYEITEITDNTPITFEVVEQSELAKTIVDFGLFGKRIYPFVELPEGMSFTVPFDGSNEKSLRVLCTVNSNKLGKKFVCIKHEALGIYEVAHIRTTPVSFFPNSPTALGKAGE